MTETAFPRISGRKRAGAASNAAYRSAKAANCGCERNATPDSPLFVAIAPGCGRDRETALARKRRPRIASDPGHVRGQIVAHRDTKPHYTTNADALVRWFESGVGHCVWTKVHREHPHVLGPHCYQGDKMTSPTLPGGSALDRQALSGQPRTTVAVLVTVASKPPRSDCSITSTFTMRSSLKYLS